MDNKKIVGIYRYEEYDKNGNKVDTFCYVEEDMSTGKLNYHFTTNKDEAINVIYRYGKENNYKSIDEMVKNRPLALNLNCKDANDVFSKIKMYNYLSNEDFIEFKDTKTEYETKNLKGQDETDDYDDDLLNPDDAEDLNDDTFATKHPKMVSIINKLPFIKNGNWLKPNIDMKKKFPKYVKRLKVAVPCVTVIALAIAGGIGLSKFASKFGQIETTNKIAVNTDKDKLDNTNNNDNKAREEAKKQREEQEEKKQEEEKKKQEEETKRKVSEEKTQQEEVETKKENTNVPTRANSNQTYTTSSGSSANSGSSSSSSSSSSSQSSGGSESTDASMPEFQDPNKDIDDATSNTPEQSQEEEKYDNIFEEEGTVPVIEGEEDSNNNTEQPDQEIDVPAKTDDNETSNEDDTTDKTEDEENIDIGDVTLDPGISEGAISGDVSFDYDEDGINGSDNYDETIDVDPGPLPSPDEVYEYDDGDNITTEGEFEDAQSNQETAENTNTDTVPVEQEETEVQATEPQAEVSESVPVETVPVEQAVDQAIEAYANGTDGNLVVGADGNITFEENTNTNVMEANGMTK